jgi:hypothetical protein
MGEVAVLADPEAMVSHVDVTAERARVAPETARLAHVSEDSRQGRVA